MSLGERNRSAAESHEVAAGCDRGEGRSARRPGSPPDTLVGFNEPDRARQRLKDQECTAGSATAVASQSERFITAFEFPELTLGAHAHGH
jgi:hypothetical protein